jgi:hypothetical protein|tara:strand:- start:27 stop:236 length:210 start_codon:yes stop_codon:yes gene_type:complete
MFKLGDLVKVSFGLNGVDSIPGIFIRDDTYATGLDKDGWPVITRAYVLWEGEICSTPLGQIESFPTLDG